MPKSPDKRLRFTVEQDMQLLQEVIKQNPFQDVDKWVEIHENFVNECNVPFSLRTCKDHANHLLNLYLKNSLKMRPRELQQDFEAKKDLLEQILQLRQQYGNESVSKRKPRSSNHWEEHIFVAPLQVKQESSFAKTEDDSDDDFYWKEENERDKIEKDREANDADNKLRKRELELEERRLSLREKQLRLDDERLQLDKLERDRRTEMDKLEREAYKRVAIQNQIIVTSMLDRYNRRNNGNLCIL